MNPATVDRIMSGAAALAAAALVLSAAVTVRAAARSPYRIAR